MTLIARKIAGAPGAGDSFVITFPGPAWSEADLTGYAYAFEQRKKVRNKVQPSKVLKTELRLKF
jgi:hypothetical protein